MSYDFSLLNPSGNQVTSVSLNPSEHFAIFGSLDVEKYRVFSKAKDYYRDADFDISEISTLRDELEAYTKEMAIDAIQYKLQLLTELLKQAIAEGKAVAAISD